MPEKDEETYRVVLAIHGKDGSAKMVHHTVARAELEADKKLAPLLKLYERMVLNKDIEDKRNVYDRPFI